MGDPDDGRVRIITHKRPHLDEVVGIWLLKTFDPRCATATIEFVPYFTEIAPAKNVITLGIGGGKFDEHKMAPGTSATKLVYEDLVARKLIDGVKHEPQAVAWLVEFSDQVDQAKVAFKDEANWAWSLPSLITSHARRTNDDADCIRFGLEVMANVMAELNDKARFMDDWAARQEFMTPWGRGVAVTTDYGSSEVYAFSHGFVLRIHKKKTAPYASLKGDPDLPIDLSAAAEKVMAAEPQSWYLHQSKRMLISMVDPATGRPHSNFSLQQLIDLVKV